MREEEVSLKRGRKGSGGQSVVVKSSQGLSEWKKAPEKRNGEGVTEADSAPGRRDVTFRKGKGGDLQKADGETESP